MRIHKLGHPACVTHGTSSIQPPVMPCAALIVRKVTCVHGRAQHRGSRSNVALSATRWVSPQEQQELEEAQPQTTQQQGQPDDAREQDVMSRVLFVKLSLAQSTGKLDLTDCRLKAIPPEVFDLKDLEDLSLAGNCLTSLPEDIGRLTNLKKLGLAGNRLSSLPNSIGQLTQLEGLWLHGNLLSSIPDALGAVTNLRQLSLSGNQLTALPDVWSSMQQMDDLAIAGNQLTQLPASLGSMASLRKLTLNGNQLTSLPAALGGLVGVQELWLQGNQLRELPHEALSGLKSLKELSLADNQLTALPASFVALKALQQVWLYGNQLTALPHNLFSALPTLTHCWLEGNPGLQGQVVQDALQDVRQVLAASPSTNNPSQAGGAGGSWQQLKGLAQASGPKLKAVGLDTRQLAGVPAELVQAVSSCLKVGEVQGTGPGYFKMSPSPLTLEACRTSGLIPAQPDGCLPRQAVLVVALGSAPGTPNWGGLLGKMYKAAKTPEEKAFDVLYVVDPSRQWYGASQQSGGSSSSSSTPSVLQYYYSRLQEVTQRYEHVVMLGDSMGATAALLFAPLATHVLAFCPQVDLSTSCMRPGVTDGALAQLKSYVLEALQMVGSQEPAGSSSTDDGVKGCRVMALSGTWQHDLDQVNALPDSKVKHQVYSLESHRLALYLESQGKLLPLVQDAVLKPLGVKTKAPFRPSNLL